MSLSLANAKKHVALALRVRHIAGSCGYQDRIYLATHSVRWYKPTYSEAEGNKVPFWSIKTWWRPYHNAVNLKDPDAVIVVDGRLQYLIEIKSGTLEDGKSDWEMGAREGEKLRNLLAAEAAFCNIAGPKNQPQVCERKISCAIDEGTEYLLVTRIADSSEHLSFLDVWLDTGFKVADIERPTAGFPSLAQILSRQC